MAFVFDIQEKSSFLEISYFTERERRKQLATHCTKQYYNQYYYQEMRSLGNPFKNHNKHNNRHKQTSCKKTVSRKTAHMTNAHKQDRDINSNKTPHI